MKKVLRSLVMVALVFCAVFGMRPLRAQAAVKVTIPKKVQCDVGMQNWGAFSSSLKYGDKVKNVKSSSSNLRVTAKECEDEYSNSAKLHIFYYAKKAGNYTIKFDVYKANGKKRKSYTVKVYAKNGIQTVVDSIVVNGKKTKVQTGTILDDARGGWLSLTSYEYGERRFGVDEDVLGLKDEKASIKGYFFSAPQKNATVKFNLKKGLKILEIYKVTLQHEEGFRIWCIGSEQKFQNGSKIGAGWDAFRIVFQDSFDGKKHICYCFMNYSNSIGDGIAKELAVSVDGKEVAIEGNSGYVLKKSGKVKFALKGALAGAKITKITVSTENKKGKISERTFKNGSKIAFSKGGEEEWFAGPASYAHDMLYLRTTFKIDYKLKGKNESIYFTLYSPR